jgi:hypothetical protein
VGEARGGQLPFQREAEADRALGVSGGVLVHEGQAGAAVGGDAGGEDEVAAAAVALLGGEQFGEQALVAADGVAHVHQQVDDRVGAVEVVAPGVRLGEVALDGVTSSAVSAWAAGAEVSRARPRTVCPARARAAETRRPA